MCIFCKIVAGEIPSTRVYEDDAVLGFEDLNPAAPRHLLFIPKIHVENFVQASSHPGLIDSVFRGIGQYCREHGLEEEGLRVVSNSGASAGQSVFHLHFHLLGGRRLTWPPG